MGTGESLDAHRVAAADDLDRLCRRLHSLSPRAWQDRRGPAQEALAGLVRIQSEIEGRQLEAPNVADHVIPDAIAVVGGDLLDAAVSRSDVTVLAQVRRLLAAALAGTR